MRVKMMKRGWWRGSMKREVCFRNSKFSTLYSHWNFYWLIGLELHCFWYFTIWGVLQSQNTKIGHVSNMSIKQEHAGALKSGPRGNAASLEYYLPHIFATLSGASRLTGLVLKLVSSKLQNTPFCLFILTLKLALGRLMKNDENYEIQLIDFGNIIFLF